ncbi:MAG: YtxH domain-containing protein [Actinobacteria bacterium]|nr:YtxH domain-containing protein [Actinomycetota bacterium]
MQRFFSFIAGTVCGALVGATVALLLAPYSGQELRVRARRQLESVQGDVRDAYSARRAQLEAELESLRHPKVAGTAD